MKYTYICICTIQNPVQFIVILQPFVCGILFKRRVATGIQYIISTCCSWIRIVRRANDTRRYEQRAWWSHLHSLKKGVLRTGNVTSYKPIRCVRRPVYCYTHRRPSSSSYLYVIIFKLLYFFSGQIHQIAIIPIHHPLHNNILYMILYVSTQTGMYLPSVPTHVIKS